MAAFQFDSARLVALQTQVPSTLQLLRLRLRFGLPQTLRIGQRFHISLELVDEMGQPAASVPVSDLQIRMSHESSNATSESGIELKARELVSSASRESCRWSFDAEFSFTTARSNQSQDDAEHDGKESAELLMGVTILLQVGLKVSAKRALARNTEFHDAFQQFCSHSMWIDAQTLVLPVLTQRIRLLSLSSSSSEEDAVQVPKTLSSLCSRVFSVTRPHIAKKKFIMIQENYGDTMGSHIWDASILLAFALCSASQFPFPKHSQNHTMLELGAGCGLFAAVYAALSDDMDCERRSMVLTERRESLTLLEANLQLNSETDNTVDEPGDSVRRGPAIQFLPLVWGDLIDENALPEGGVDTIFAADVLYNWSAHEPLLRTIDAIVQLKQHQAKAEKPTGASGVFIAHKHRGSKAASSAFLEHLLTGSDENCCDSKSSAKYPEVGECQWTNWHVSRAACLGKVDILLLTRKPESPSLQGTEVR